jgi:integrase
MSVPNQNLNVIKSLPEWMLKGYSYQGGVNMADLIIQKGGVWYAKCTYKGVRLRGSLKTKDRGEAIERLVELQLMVREGVYQYHKIQFDSLAEKYDPQIDRKNKLANLDNHLKPAFQGKRLSEIDVQAWAKTIAGKYKESTALAIIRVARELGFPIDYKALPLIPNKKFDGTQILTEELALKILDTLGKGPRSKKYQAICRVAMYSTLPLSDLLHLRKKDVVFSGPADHGITYIRRKTRYKNKPALFVPMTNKLREAFKSLPTPLADDGYWFPRFKADAVSNTVGRAFKKCGWHHGSAMHNFRHFGACHLIRHGVPLPTITELMGHSNYDTTLIYARTDREKLIEGVKKFDAK